MTALLAISTLPDLESAVKLARHLVESRSASCVHVLPLGQSIYRWQGQIETATEATLLIKTTVASYPILEQELARLHPYDVPELIALPITQGLEPYLNWIEKETA